MPGGKCEASRLPEGRSRKQTRQKLENDEEQRQAERRYEQRHGRPRPGRLGASAQTLRRRRQRRRARRCGTRIAMSRGRAASLSRCVAGRHGWRETDRSRGARAGDSSLARRGRPIPCLSVTRAGRCPVVMSMRRGPRHRLLDCRRRRRNNQAARRGRICCRDGVRDGRCRLSFGACHSRGNGCRRAGRRRRDGCGRRRDLPRGQRLRVAHGGVGLLQQLRRRGGAGIGARDRRNGKNAERDRHDENAGAHTAMIRPAHPHGYRPPGGSFSPQPGGSYEALLAIRASKSPRRPASTAASTRLPTPSFRIALLRYSLTVCRLR